MRASRALRSLADDPAPADEYEGREESDVEPCSAVAVVGVRGSLWSKGIRRASTRDANRVNACQIATNKPGLSS